MDGRCCEAEVELGMYFAKFAAVTLRPLRVVLKGRARYSLSLPLAELLLFYNFRNMLDANKSDTLYLRVEFPAGLMTFALETSLKNLASVKTANN